MEMQDKDKLIQEKFDNLIQPENLVQLWTEEKKKRYQLLSISSLVINVLGRDLPRIEEWCLEQGFDGMEIRIQDFVGFKEGFDSSLLEKFKPQGIITVHLSDWSSWIPLYRNDSKALLKTFYSSANVIKYFGGENPDIIIDRLDRELDIAGRLGVKAATWHANQIDYDDILFGEKQYSDQEIIEIVSEFSEKLIGRNSGYSQILSLENGSAIDRGVRRFKDFKELFTNPALSEVGITFDTAHMTAVLSQEVGSKDKPIDQQIFEELQSNPDALKKIRAVHLSDSMTTSSFIKEASPEQLKKAKEDFWYKRELVRDVVVDDHIPIGFVFQAAKQVLELVSSNTKNKLSVVWELRPGDFASLKKSIDIQKVNILYEQ